ncbi:hypothetical protein D3C75_845070 [compost metagenome]
MHAHGVGQGVVQQPVAGELGDADDRQDESGEHEGQQGVLEITQIFQCPAGDVIRQEHVDIEIERLAQGVGEGGFAQVQQVHQHQAGSQQLVGPGAAEGQGVALFAQVKGCGEQHRQCQ